MRTAVGAMRGAAARASLFARARAADAESQGRRSSADMGLVRLRTGSILDLRDRIRSVKKWLLCQWLRLVTEQLARAPDCAPKCPWPLHFPLLDPPLAHKTRLRGLAPRVTSYPQVIP